MEEALLDWITEMRHCNLRVSKRMIRAKAKELASSQAFKASKGWVWRFMKRHGPSLRRKTTVCQSPPADSIPKLVSYIMHLRNLRKRHKYQPPNVIAMDETACWMDMPSDTTVDSVGARSIPIKTTGHTKDHYTVILTARSDGTKLKPYVVFKGKGTRLIKDLQRIPGVAVRFSSNGWMNDGLALDYLNSIIGPLSFRKRLLVWDAYRCHTSQAVRAGCSKLNLHTAIVPGGCTKFIQAPDVVWNACFKSNMRRCYDSWLSEPSLHEFTRGGNMKAPSRSLVCEWVKSAVSTQMVRDSFLSCAITTSLSGCDDSKIHCFKPGQPCEAGRSVLADEMKKFNSSDDTGANDVDPFASDTDEEADDDNELLIEQSEPEEGESEERSESESELSEPEDTATAQ